MRRAHGRTNRGDVLVAVLVASAGALVAGPAAADAKDDAAAAYDKGAAAYDRGDFAVAATELARADELAPNPVTLELAIGAAVRADDAVLGMALVERASARRGTKALDKAAEAARRKLSSRAGKLDVACPRECEVRVDGKRFERTRPSGGWLLVGSHDVAIAFGGSVQRSTVTIESGKTVALLPTAPAPVEEGSARGGAAPPERAASAVVAPKEPRPAAASSGASPTWFWVALGATAVAGGATLVSGLDTASKHDEFVRDRSNVDAANEGKAADQRTTVLVGVTGVLAVATAAVGLFVVDWSGGGSAATGLRRLPSRLSFAGTGATVRF